MRVVYKTKEIGNNTTLNYNSLLKKPIINEKEVVGNVTALDIDTYNTLQVDQEIAKNRSVKQVYVLPSPTAINTTYYVGPNSEGLYDIYLADSLNQLMYLGDTTPVEFTEGFAIDIDSESDVISIEKAKILALDDEIKDSPTIKIWTGTDPEYETVLDTEKSDEDTLYVTYTSVSDIAVKNKVTLQKVYDSIYPIGTINIGFDQPNVPTGIIATWTLKSDYDGNAIWIDSVSSEGSFIQGSLPRISGGIDFPMIWAEAGTYTATGAFSDSIVDRVTNALSDIAGDTTQIDFKASNSNAIYSASAGANIVRPTAVVVNVWERTA